MNKKYISISLLLIIVIILSTYFIIKNQKTSKSPLQSEISPGTNIIQAKLISAENPSYNSVAKLYDGTLTFQNLNDLKQHTYWVCLEDWSTVKLNEIYDLPANYYIPHGGPDESMETNGCNGPLHLSNVLSNNLEKNNNSTITQTSPKAPDVKNEKVTTKNDVLKTAIITIEEDSIPIDPQSFNYLIKGISSETGVSNYVNEFTLKNDKQNSTSNTITLTLKPGIYTIKETQLSNWSSFFQCRPDSQYQENAPNFGDVFKRTDSMDTFSLDMRSLEVIDCSYTNRLVTSSN